MNPTPRKKNEIPKGVKWPKWAGIAELAMIAEMNPRTFRDMLNAAGMLPKNGLFDAVASLRAAIRHERSKATAQDADNAKDRARRTRAEADSAELDVEKKLGNLILASDAQAMWADGFVQMRTVIEQENRIPLEVRKSLVESFLRIRLSDDSTA